MVLLKLSHKNLQWLICFSGFMDLFGVSMLFPLLVDRARALGASPSYVGLFGSIYGFLQFFTSPIMGQISDHKGRKAVLLVSMVGTSIGYFLLGLSNTILLLALARIPSGIFKHSQSMSRTYLADITPKKETASIFGTFNSMSSVGFIIGPAVGGIVGSAENGFFKVAVMSSFTFFLNACVVFLFVPDNCDSADKKCEDEGNRTKKKMSLNLFSSFNAFKDFHLIPWRKVWGPFLIKFLFALAIILFRSNFTSIMKDRFHVDTRTNGFIMSFNGIASAIGSASVRWISPHFRNNNNSLHNTFATVLVFALMAITLAPTLNAVIIAIVPLCIASSVLRVTNSIAIYEKGGDQVKGLLVGLSDTLTSLSRTLGPAIAGFSQELSVYGPGSCGTFFAFLATLVGFYISNNLKKHDE